MHIYLSAVVATYQVRCNLSTGASSLSDLSSVDKLSVAVKSVSLDLLWRAMVIQCVSTVLDITDEGFLVTQAINPVI